MKAIVHTEYGPPDVLQEIIHESDPLSTPRGTKTDTTITDSHFRFSGAVRKI